MPFLQQTESSLAEKHFYTIFVAGQFNVDPIIVEKARAAAAAAFYSSSPQSLTTTSLSALSSESRAASLAAALTQSRLAAAAAAAARDLTSSSSFYQPSLYSTASSPSGECSRQGYLSEIGCWSRERDFASSKPA